MTKAILCGLAAGVIALASSGPARAGEEKAVGDWLQKYNIIYESPSKDFHGAMLIGNGDIGASLWVEEGGDLVFYIGKTDAYDDNNRLLKLGRVRVKLAPNPFAKGLPFRQELRLRQGEIEIRAGKDGAAVTCRAWVDANLPVIRAEVEGKRPTEAQVLFETWRTQERDITGELSHSDALRGSPERTIQYPDAVLPDQRDCIVWYHHNAKSVWPVTMKLQGLEECMKGALDPLLERTFGGMIVGEGMTVGADATTLKSRQPREKHRISIYILTKHPASPRDWLEELTGVVVPRVEGIGPAEARAAHRKWWDEFWNRSWVRVSGPVDALPPSAGSGGAVTATRLPLRIGADSIGQTRFRGRIARVRVWSAALPAQKLAALAAQGRDQAAPKDPALVAEWAPGELAGGTVPNRAGDGLAARLVGDLKVVEADGAKALEFDGKGYLEVAHDDRLNLAGGVTLEAWIAPDKIDPAGARIIDKTPVATSEGYLLDTWPGNSLRLIVKAGTVTHDAKLPPGRWVHVAGTYDPKTGEEALYVGGRAVPLGAGGPSAPAAVSTFAMSRGYALQRYLMACGGRGNMWTKFNGSIFTLPYEKADPDYRRWAGAQWFQNARLSYWPCLASGDYEMMTPFYRTYLAALPMALERTRIYYGHDGAFFPETLYFWGTYANPDYGWDRKGLKVGYATNPYIHYYWSGGLELSAMMLDHYAHTQDRVFLVGTVLPLAGAIVEFHDRHWQRDEKGKIRMEPAQSLETWQSVVNPLPDIAGLKFVVGELAALPEDVTSAKQREDWRRLLGELPPVPTREVDGKTVLSAAEKILQGASNVENPELYAVFPYRLYGVDKPDLAVGIETFNRRQHRENRCWWQCDTHAAYLGLAGTAARNVLRRLCNYNTAFPFPAMWGPHNDEIPDMDHGGNGQMALQVMLMQAEGRKILLLPAWPKEWDVEFKLHAPLHTVVEGVYHAGKLEPLKVTPEARAKDVVVMQPK